MMFIPPRSFLQLLVWGTFSLCELLHKIFSLYPNVPHWHKGHLKYKSPDMFQNLDVLQEFLPHVAPPRNWNFQWDGSHFHLLSPHKTELLLEADFIRAIDHKLCEEEKNLPLIFLSVELNAKTTLHGIFESWGTITTLVFPPVLSPKSPSSSKSLLKNSAVIFSTF